VPSDIDEPSGPPPNSIKARGDIHIVVCKNIWEDLMAYNTKLLNSQGSLRNKETVSASKYPKKGASRFVTRAFIEEG